MFDPSLGRLLHFFCVIQRLFPHGTLVAINVTLSYQFFETCGALHISTLLLKSRQWPFSDTVL